MTFNTQKHWDSGSTQ